MPVLIVLASVSSLGRHVLRYWRAPLAQVGGAWSTWDRHLPARLPIYVWLAASALFLTTYTFMWSVVHVYVDVNPCLFKPPDPMFAVIPYDRLWFWLTHDVYEWVTVFAVGSLVLRAARGDHRPLVVFGTALAVQAMLRSTTMYLLPLCRVNVEVGTRAIETVPHLDLGLFSIPWRVWASNDLVFSGHVGEFLLLQWVGRHWPKPMRIALIVFQVLQAYALIATRGHYTVDIIVAVPCALFAYRSAIWLLLRAAGKPGPDPALGLRPA